MSIEPEPDLAPLRALLHDPAPDPAAALRRLSAARREAAAADANLAAEVLAAEERWIERRRASRDEVSMRADLEQLHRDWLHLRIERTAAAAPTAAVVLDLADAAAAADEAGATALAERAASAASAAVPRIEATESARHEVADRFAVLTTAIDDLSMPHQMAVLRRTGTAIQQLGRHWQDRTTSRIGRRLLRAADDRVLAYRLEQRLGRRGVTVLEGTNFVLLLVVLVTLLVEATVPLTPQQETALHWIDALACSFFVADFTFELVLHPSRWSWFWRNALTDLVPAIPSVLFLVPFASAPAAADKLLLLRTLRLLRVTWAARYVQALRPILRSARLLLFLVRGLDGLAARFAHVLNREFVFAPAAADPRGMPEPDERRELVFAALRREHDLVDLLPRAERHDALRERIAAVRAAMAGLGPTAAVSAPAGNGREVPIGAVVDFLLRLRAQDLGRWLSTADQQALDRVVRVLSAVPVRWLPIIRRFAVHPLPATAEDRILALARRVAARIETVHERLLFVADLHGIVTGPQILDRVATAMVKASQRPAVRLLLFGGLFSVLRLFWEKNCLSSVVGLPLVLLGGICLVFLTLGHWLKRLAGQASESYRLTSEAHFISQLERVPLREEREELTFLARRVFGDSAARVLVVLQAQVDSVRTGVPERRDGVDERTVLAANRVALLYLHERDGAPLHESDVKTTEQLLANQSIENLREQFLRCDARERKRLRKLRLDEGSLFSGPYLWFQFVTESLAVEAAKRIAGYNRFCIPLAERTHTSPEALELMQEWLRRRRDPRGGRTPKERRGARDRIAYPATEFTALDFLGGDPERDRHLASMFGEDVVATLRIDRRTMVREIFGTRSVHHLPRDQRAFNPLRFYERRLSHGRVILLPLLLGWRFLCGVAWVVKKVREVVREVLDPEAAMQRHEVGEAPFAVALRKIHRMKAPGLLEAMRMRLRLDPVYAGAPAGWSHAATEDAGAEVLRDAEFLQLREREAAEFRDQAAEVRRHVLALHAATAWMPALGERGDDEATVRAGELAVTCAWIADRDCARTLLFAERWRQETLPELLADAEPTPVLVRLARGIGRWFGEHAVDRFVRRHANALSRAERRALRSAYAKDVPSVRAVVDAWSALEPGTSPAATAIATLRASYRQGAAVQRDLQALRAVQSLAVLNVRTCRDLVFQLGAYAADGEDRDLVGALP
jgi:hypothetical protein